jgi:hemerythrin-like domain-containing protein
MNLNQRVELLLQGEHKQLRDLLPIVDQAIRTLRPPAPDKKAEQAKKAKSSVAEPATAHRPFNPRALGEAWKEFREKLEPHMDNEQKVVLPLLLSVVKEGNVAQRDTLKQWVMYMQSEHVQLRRLAGVVRVETMPNEVAPIRRKVLEALDAFEAHTRAEELEIYPAVEGNETPVVTRRRTSDEIMHTLRRARPEPEPEPTEEEPAGFFGRLKGLFGR